MQNTINLQHLKSHGINTPPFSLCNLNLVGRLVNIIDGDSLNVVLPIFGNYYKYSIRLNGIDTCEMKSKNTQNKNKALIARASLFNYVKDCNDYDESLTKKDIQHILDEHPVLVWVECLEFDKYGRLLAEVYKFDECTMSKVQDSPSFSEYLLQHKLAYKYTGQTKLSEQDQIQVLTP